MKGTVRRYLGVAAIVAVLVPAWFFLAPPQLGGSTSYVVVTGNSMEPLLHADDLVLVRNAPYYEVGDVAAYHSEQLDRLVLHRIVELEEGSFVFQGDNNDFIDPERPAENELQGSLWVNIPTAGSFVRFMQGPIGIAIAAVVVLALLGVFSIKRRRKRRGRHSIRRQRELAATDAPRRSAPPPPPPRPSAVRPVAAPSVVPRSDDDGIRSPNRRRVVQLVASMAAGAVVLFGVVGAITLARPATVPVADELFFEHSGTFSYEASVPGSQAYDGPKVTTGEPIFLRVVDEATFRFDYTFASKVPYDVTTQASLTARLGAENGLSRTLELTGGESEGDGAVDVTATVSLHDLRSIVREIERETGVEQGIYTVTFLPRVDVTGTLSGEDLETSFAPALQLEFDSLQLRTPQSGSEDEGDPFSPEETASMEVVVDSPNQVVVFDRSVSIETIERVALYGGSAALLILVVALAFLATSRPKGEPARIAAKYGGALIAVSEAPTHVDTVEVTDFRTLVRLAEQFETPILHESSAGAHVYMVPNDGILYRYRAGARTVPDPSTPTAPAPTRKAQ